MVFVVSLAAVTSWTKKLPTRTLVVGAVLSGVESACAMEKIRSPGGGFYVLLPIDLHLSQRLLYILDYVVGMFDTQGDPDQVLAHPETRPARR